MSDESFPVIRRMESDVKSHGEVHAVVEELDEEVEIRQGTAAFEYDAHVITLEDGQTTERIGMDRVVSWYLPVERRH